MYDNLLYRQIKDVPIAVIQEKVSEATKIPLSLILLGNKAPGARRKEYVMARQISMYLSKDLTRFSLAVIGVEHAGRDHATVLHSIKTITNFIDINDHDVTLNVKKSIDLIRTWNNNRPDKIRQPTLKELIRKKKYLSYDIKVVNEQINALLMPNIPGKSKLVKTWILNKVPLDVRQKLLLILVNIKNYESKNY
ncbi:MAG: Chromosomal replication initiator protein DnaA [candidate division TM6 bacterium GW2011_GWF2_33_332]|nr:MAG: Chromosomal replication initiator protein DnaA [candidate division TM6 bacterium GW2011_GWF2_33_332]